MVKVPGAVGLWHMVRLLDQLAIDLVTEGPEVMAGLQDALDDGDGVRHCLDLLQGVEDLHGFVLEAAVALLLLYCEGRGSIHIRWAECRSCT